MSYGQPCTRITAGPLAGPASADPTFNRPASICFTDMNDAFDSAKARPASSAAPMSAAALLRNRLRFWVLASGMYHLGGRHARHDCDGDLDVAAGGVGIRTDMMSCFHQFFGNLPIHAGQ